MKAKLSEAQVKKAVNDYLQIGANQGKWIFHRLQCGSRLIDYGDHKQKMQFCDAGTADYEVHQAKILKIWRDNGIDWIPFEYCLTTYLEIKSTIGKQSPEQKEFQRKAEAQNCRYFIVRDASQLGEILS